MKKNLKSFLAVGFAMSLTICCIVEFNAMDVQAACGLACSGSPEIYSGYDNHSKECEIDEDDGDCKQIKDYACKSDTKSGGYTCVVVNDGKSVCCEQTELTTYLVTAERFYSKGYCGYNNSDQCTIIGEDRWFCDVEDKTDAVKTDCQTLMTSCTEI